MSSLNIVEKVRTFLQNVVNKKYLVVLNLNNGNRLSDDVLRAIIDSILPFCSLIIITYDVAIRLESIEEQSIQDVADVLLTMGPKAVIVQDKDGQRHVAVKDNDEMLKIKHFVLQSHCPTLCTEKFATEIAAFLARLNLPVNIVIRYCDLYLGTENLICSPLPRISMLTFTQELWSSVNDIYRRILELSFVNKMLDSTLDERVYDYYIVQDYCFFIDRGYMLKGLIDQCKTDEELCKFFKNQSEKNEKYVRTILGENNLPSCDEKTIKRMPACAKYTQLMRKLGESREDFSWVTGLIALLPCTLVYAKVGDWMIASGVRPTVKRYADFIEMYRDQARHDRLAYFLELTNRVVNSCSYEVRQKLKGIFREVCECEYAFWDDAYRYGMEKISEIVKNNLGKEEMTWNR